MQQINWKQKLTNDIKSALPFQNSCMKYHVLPIVLWNINHFRQKKKNKLFDCPPLPAPNYWKLKKKKKITVQKYAAPNFQNQKKKKKKKKGFFSVRMFDLLKIFCK